MAPRTSSIETGPGWAGRVGVRHVLFLGAAAAILLGPAERQVFGRNGLFHGWTMYSRVGLGLIQVDYRVRAADGVERRVDRHALLGSPSRRDEGRYYMKKIGTIAAAEKVGRELCQKLGPGTDLRLYAKKAVRRGWKPLAAGEENLCAGG